MRLIIPCMQCLQEFGRPSGEFARVEFKDDGCYEVTCSFGHATVTVLQQHKFEVLFDIGAHAILDGYYREAVSSFTSSLERFYEFAIRIFLEKTTESDALFQSVWKSVSSQSERQLGAFIFLWATHFKEAASLLPQGMITFRNEVIHKGKIPSRDEAIKYGNSVLEVLRPKLKALQKNFPDQVGNSVFRQIRGSAEKASNQIQVATMCAATIISLSNGEPSHHEKSLEEHLISLNESRKLFGSV
ncbi:hypothetical protein RHP75_04610 [Pseudomonas sp. SG20056]|uniref:hypothetical protein n=1 Tax=Pseudomonas sp. SG20056 TaxID=3074146 RepID=UPI00287F87CE|nr:hypothetical protein [Pseudomonas sp. SG20056]WNF47725.1 hypothetical protein RHP75_04610 [Pseudomonas sp. SG20056]